MNILLLIFIVLFVLFLIVIILLILLFFQLLFDMTTTNPCKVRGSGRICAGPPADDHARWAVSRGSAPGNPSTRGSV